MPKKIYVRDNNGEKNFEYALINCAALFGVTYKKLDDPIINKDRYKAIKRGHSAGNKRAGFETETRRQYDGTMRSKLGNFPIECKYNDNTLERHQRDNGIEVDAVNGSFFVLRKEVLEISRKVFNFKTTYYVEKIIDSRLKKIYFTEKLEDIVFWFLAKRGEGESHISHWVSWIE